MLTSSAEDRQTLVKQIERDDIVMFINACFAASNQNEYYNTGITEGVSIQFLHSYVLYNYRKVYARCLAAGINHFNQALIICNLLASGSSVPADFRNEENALIRTALAQLPANRAYTLLHQLSVRKINNRRARAVAKHFLHSRRQPEFDAVKYRRQYRSVVRHAHIDIGSEFTAFLFDFKNQNSFNTPLFEDFRQAHYSQAAVYRLPFSIAEPFAVKHDIDRAEFLKKIEPKMTRTERLRMQQASARVSKSKKAVSFDPSTASLTRLCIYCLSLTLQERLARAQELHAMLSQAASRYAQITSAKLPRTALVLDCSQSSRGSREKANRPMAIAIAVRYLVEAISPEVTTFWTPAHSFTDAEHGEYAFLRQPTGQTALALPVIDALQSKPELLVIVSDGWENDPPLTTGDVIDVARAKLPDVSGINIVHANPVFDPDHFSPRPLSKRVATVGLRDAEDLPTMISFARFASGASSLADLEAYLLARSKQLQSAS